MMDKRIISDYKEILVVDDTPANLHLLTHILTDNGYCVRPVSRGDFALRSIAVKKPDLIILDVKLPDIDGYEICRRLKEDVDLSKIPVIFISALADTSEKVEGLKAGGVDYITKPFEPEEVLTRISIHLQLYALSEHMEKIIQKRTETLKITNAKLRKEIVNHKRSKELLYKSNQVYRALSDCNQAVVRATNEKELLNDVCQIILDDCGYHSTWICLTENDTKQVTSVAYASYNEEDFPDRIAFWSEEAKKISTLKKALQKSSLIIENDILRDPDFIPLRDDAVQQGYASFAVIPIINDKESVGMLYIYAADANAFGKQEINLLKEIAGDLAYGIMSLRIKEERNKILVELKESEELHRITLENILDPIFITDDEGRFTYICPNIINLLGYTKEDIKSMGNISNLLGENLFDINQLKKMHEISNIERVITCKDWRKLNFLVTVKCVNIKGGTVLYTCHDVTDLMKAEKELRENEQRFRTLVSNIPGIVYRCAYDEHWTMHYISDFVEALSGYPAYEFIENNVRSFTSIIHQDDRSMVSEVIAKALTKRKDYVLEYRIVAVDGTVKWVYEKGQAIYNDQNQLLWLDGAIFDITDYKNVQEIREKLINDLEKRNAEMERFIYTASHDLKTPLVTMEGFLGCLSEKLDKKNFIAAEHYIDRMKKALKIMRQLLDELVNLSKVGAIKGPKEKIIFRELLKEAIEQIEQKVSEKNITIQVDSDFPLIYGNRKSLFDVILNLLKNAVIYIGDRPKPQINIGFDNTQDAFYIKDTGIGIDPKYFDKIFNLFEQLDPSIEGTGIGLCIVKRVIEFHKGKIWVQSEGTGKGSIFYFTIPKEEGFSFEC